MLLLGMKYLLLILCFGISAPQNKQKNNNAAIAQQEQEIPQFKFLSPEENKQLRLLLTSTCDLLAKSHNANKIMPQLSALITLMSFIRLSNEYPSINMDDLMHHYLDMTNTINKFFDIIVEDVRKNNFNLLNQIELIDKKLENKLYKYGPLYMKFHQHFLNIFAPGQKTGKLENRNFPNEDFLFFNSTDRTMIMSIPTNQKSAQKGFRTCTVLKPISNRMSAIMIPFTTQSGFAIQKLYKNESLKDYSLSIFDFHGLNSEMPFTSSHGYCIDNPSSLKENLNQLCDSDNWAFIPFPSKRTKARMLLAYLQPVLKAIKDKSKGARRRANKQAQKANQQAQKDEKKGDITSDEITTAHDITINEGIEENISTELTTNIENANAGIYTEITDEEIDDAVIYTESDDAEYKAQIDILLDIYYSDINTQNKDIKKALAWVNTIIKQIRAFEHEENGKENAESFIDSLANIKHNSKNTSNNAKAATSSSANDDDDDSGNQIQSNQISLPVIAGTLNPKQLSMALTELLQFKIDVSNADRTKGDHFMYVGKYGTATLAHRDEYHPGLVRQIMKQFASHFKGITDFTS